jgi:cytochrome c peroxidase
MEMGATWPEVMARLSQDTKLTDTFAKLYSHGLTQQNILNAIAVFEQSLVTPNSRFDKYLYGDKNILSSEEIHGYELFKNNCISCHAGQSLGGLSFEKLGLKVNFQSRRTPNDADQGRFNVTKNIIDKHKFKVPTLRNIDQSYPYFHDGSVKTLEEAVALMGKYQAGKNFTTAEINDISAFLRSLTGEYEGRLLSDAHN